MNEMLEVESAKSKINDNVKEANILSLKTRIYLPFKRILDILFGIIGTILTIPFILIIKVFYVLNKDYSSIFFIHKRIGKDGKEFKMYKFRTMVPNAEEVLKEMLKDKKYLNEWKEYHKFENDPRITKVGGIFRKLSLDELPQFINILKGDMSLIGPRPLIQEEVNDYKNKKKILLSIKPGLTGWWACHGRSCTSNKQRQDLELYYVKNCSFILDIKAFFLTIVKVLKREGAM
jgi:lipopolysaccharide/colanic/teichoic acid biosynthesis glycosyltransferase